MELKERLTQIVASISKDLNWPSAAISVVGTFISIRLGGWDNLLIALFWLVIIDYITGILKAWKTNTLDTEVGFVGLIKKVIIFVMVAVAVVAETVIGDSIPLRELVIMFYIANEGMSLLENTSEFIPLPPAVQKTFVQIRDRSNDDETKK